jgi:thioredoxin reductase (NADPH)
MRIEDVIIVGGGPCGLAAAIDLQKIGINPLIIEKGNIVNAIYKYPTHQTFFSTSEKLAIGEVPFITENRKPVRNQALAYYREVVKRKKLQVKAYEKVITINQNGTEHFEIKTQQTDGKENLYKSKFVIIATGYYDNPNLMGIPGEKLEKVFHYFKEAHPYFDKDVVVIGGKNSAIDAALELERAGARVTVLYRGCEYSSSIKPWILPEFDSLVRQGIISMYFEAIVQEITSSIVTFNVRGKEMSINNDFVFAMTGYRPDHQFLSEMGVKLDEASGRPIFNSETMETNVEGIFIAGVIAAGNNANEIFIENGRFHGALIAQEVAKRKTPSE